MKARAESGARAAARRRAMETARAVEEHAAARRRWPGVTRPLTDEGGAYWFSAANASAAVDWFPAYLRHIEGEHAGQPFVLLDWQRELLIRPLFGWFRGDGTRRFRRIFLEIGKKNGKSGLCSGLGLFLAFADGEPGAQVYAAAGAEDQAQIVFKPSQSMAENSPALLTDYGLQVMRHSIVGPASSVLRPLTSKVRTQHGLNIHGLIFDEFHAQRDRELWETLYRGVSARRQPVVIIITTAGDDRESICREEYERACRVRDGALPDDSYLPVIFEASATDDWTSEATWRKANPSLGVTKRLDYMREECRSAIDEPRKRNAFLRLELNIWTETRTVWITPEAWAECRADRRGTKWGEDHGKLLACGGLDLSATADLTALVLAFKRPAKGRADEKVEIEAPVPAEPGAPSTPASATERRTLTLDYEVDLVPYFFMPEETLQERVHRDHVPYDVWAREGWVHVTEGSVVDYAEIHRVILEDVRARYRGLHEIGFDPWNATHLSTSLLAGGVKMVEVRQGFASLSGPSKLLEQLIRTRRLRHNGNPVMTWCVANAEAKTDANGNIRPVKPGGVATGTRRIDGVVAAIMALGRLMVAPARVGSVYGHRGVRSV